MAVKTDNLSDIENVESLKGLCMSYLEDGMYVHACVLHLMLYICICVCVSNMVVVCVCVCTHIHIQTTLQVPHRRHTNDEWA